MDIRAFLFEPLLGLSFAADLTAVEPGILAGSSLARTRALELGLRVEEPALDGTRLDIGSLVLRVGGSAEEIARGEEGTPRLRRESIGSCLRGRPLLRPWPRGRIKVVLRGMEEGCSGNPQAAARSHRDGGRRHSPHGRSFRLPGQELRAHVRRHRCGGPQGRADRRAHGGGAVAGGCGKHRQ